MDKCKRCGEVMPVDWNKKTCKDCSKVNKVAKVAVPVLLALGTGAVILITSKSRTGNASAKHLINITNKTVSSAVNTPKKVFGGLTQDALDILVGDTQRGVKATVVGDTLHYVYKSASGKTKNSVKIMFDKAGNLMSYLGNGSYYHASSPRLFLKSLQERIRRV